MNAGFNFIESVLFVLYFVQSSVRVVLGRYQRICFCIKRRLNLWDHYFFCLAAIFHFFPSWALIICDFSLGHLSIEVVNRHESLLNGFQVLKKRLFGWAGVFNIANLEAFGLIISEGQPFHRCRKLIDLFQEGGQTHSRIGFNDWRVVSLVKQLVARRVHGVKMFIIVTLR